MNDDDLRICAWCERRIWPDRVSDDGEQLYVDADGVSTCPLRYAKLFHRPLVESARRSA